MPSGASGFTWTRSFWRWRPGAGDGETSSISDDGERCGEATAVRKRRVAAAGVHSAAGGRTGLASPCSKEPEWADDSEAIPGNSAAAPESAAVLQTDRWSLRQEQAEMSDTEAGAGEEPAQRGPSESLPTSKDSMEPTVTSDLVVLEAVDMEDSWMCSISRGSSWASWWARSDSESVRGGTRAGSGKEACRCGEREKFLEAVEESLATLVEMERIDALVEGDVRLTAEEWADPNIVLPSPLILNGGIDESPGFALELRRLLQSPGSKYSSEIAGNNVFCSICG